MILVTVTWPWCVPWCCVPCSSPAPCPPHHPPPPSSITHHSASPSPNRSTPPSVSIVVSFRGVAAVSPVNIVASTSSETAATSSFCIASAVGIVSPNDPRWRVDVPANLGGNIDIGTPTTPHLAPAAMLRPLDDVGAAVDRRADVHDSVIASRGLDAWKSAPRLVLMVLSDVIVDATWTILQRPGSDSHTSDTMGNASGASAVARGVPPGTVARTDGKTQAGRAAAGRCGRAVSACANARLSSRGAKCNKGDDQANNETPTKAPRAGVARAAAADTCALNKARR
jgi:hypothetical protein